MKEPKIFEIPAGHLPAHLRPNIPWEGSRSLDKAFGTKQPEKPKTPEQIAAQSCRDLCNQTYKKPKL